MRTNRPAVSIVIAAKNEARNVAAVLPQLDHSYEIVLVDAGSVDGTVEAATAAHPSIRTVRTAAAGRGRALGRGLATATGDILVVLDVDGSADPQDIPRLVRELVDGADVAKASRRTRSSVPGGPVHRSLLSRLTAGSRLPDPGHTFIAFWRDLLPLLHLPTDIAASPRAWGDGSEIDTVIGCRLAAAGVVIAEVPTQARPAASGALVQSSRLLRVMTAERRRRARLRRQHRVQLDLPFPAPRPLELRPESVTDTHQLGATA